MEIADHVNPPPTSFMSSIASQHHLLTCRGACNSATLYIGGVEPSVWQVSSLHFKFAQHWLVLVQLLPLNLHAAWHRRDHVLEAHRAAADLAKHMRPLARTRMHVTWPYPRQANNAVSGQVLVPVDAVIAKHITPNAVRHRSNKVAKRQGGGGQTFIIGGVTVTTWVRFQVASGFQAALLSVLPVSRPLGNVAGGLVLVADDQDAIALVGPSTPRLPIERPWKRSY
jgi:hypothetical protein